MRDFRDRGFCKVAILLLLVENENGMIRERLGIVITVIILLSLTDIFAAEILSRSRSNEKGQLIRKYPTLR